MKNVVGGRKKERKGRKGRKEGIYLGSFNTANAEIAALPPLV